ncbi:DUF885 family protein [Altererythrobacter indicus]|uniref:DUF885 family protein n=2 Tax=Altericroceibacterium indicum TaxID=374177 RepID=A0A845A301_9SPHN|nr:DUF885 family protein [Altericroceibacterium indicum]
MRRLIGAMTGLALAGCATSQGPVASSPPPAEEKAGQGSSAAKGEMNTAFKAISDTYIKVLTKLNPVNATQLGDHTYDSELPAIDAAGRNARLTANKALLQGLNSLDFNQLSRDNQVDYKLLKNALEYAIWDDEVLREWQWNPQYYNDTASYSLYSLVQRDFAPWPERFQSIVSRMEKLPAFMAESRKQLDPNLVPKVYAETVSKQNEGILEIVNAVLLPEVEKSGVPRTRFDAALANLKKAVAEQQRWIDDTLVPNARGDFRLGAEHYDQKMKFALMSDMTRPELKQRALEAKAAIRSQMYELSRKILKDREDQTFPDNPDAATQQSVIERGLAYSYAVRPKRDELVEKARETLADTTAFTREKGFVAMPRGEVKIITVPKFLQGNAVAYDDAPGPLESNLPNFYAISPIPDDWTNEQATSFLSEYNMYMLHDLSMHEGVPGHYLQLDHANKNKDLLRAVLMSGPFVEGWAVYSEGVMVDLGYMTNDPLFELTVLKMRLRSVTNTLLDIGVHTEGMTRDQAMDLMMKGAFQQEREAAGKWIRANLSSVQLLSYFTGYEEHRALRKEAEERWGKDFDLRRYHDSVLSHGSPPVKYVRELLFDLPID